VVLCDVQGLSYKEIADIMETPVGTVMSRLFRGRKLLAAALREFAISEGYVKPTEARPAHNDGNDEAIDLGKYRAARAAREDSQS
jgi:RNA polymerase sigma-70 factor, ECF subfamily